MQELSEQKCRKPVGNTTYPPQHTLQAVRSQYDEIQYCAIQSNPIRDTQDNTRQHKTRRERKRGTRNETRAHATTHRNTTHLVPHHRKHNTKHHTAQHNSKQTQHRLLGAPCDPNNFHVHRWRGAGRRSKVSKRGRGGTALAQDKASNKLGMSESSLRDWVAMVPPAINGIALGRCGLGLVMGGAQKLPRAEGICTPAGWCHNLGSFAFILVGLHLIPFNLAGAVIRWDLFSKELFLF